eukprot:scaffold1032_cov99-Isochrysis_galbana.AAC.2
MRLLVSETKSGSSPSSGASSTMGTMGGGRDGGACGGSGNRCAVCLWPTPRASVVDDDGVLCSRLE